MIKSEKLKNIIIESTHQLPHENLLLVDLPGEEWRPFPIEPFDEDFLISNKGRVRRLALTIERSDGVQTCLPERIIKPMLYEKINNYLGEKKYYMTCRVKKEKYMKVFPIARIVYLSFVEPYDLYDTNIYVRYRDGNGLNCLPDNLYLFDKRQISKWTMDHGRRSLLVGASDRSQFSEEETSRWVAILKKTVSQYDLNGRFIRTFNSRTEAAASVGREATHISAAIKGKTRTSGGYMWREGHEYAEQIEVQPKKVTRVAQYCLKGNLIQIFPSIKAAAQSFGVTYKTFIYFLYNRNSCVDYIWEKVKGDEEAPVKIETNGIFKPIRNVYKKYNIPDDKYPFQIFLIEDMPDEEWKVIPGSGGTHLASNCGRIKADGQIIEHDNHHSQKRRPRMISQTITKNKKTGQLSLEVNFRSNRKKLTFQIPNLIYRLFHGEIPLKYTIRFKDNDPLNCKAENLQTVSLSDIFKQYYQEGRFPEGPFRKSVVQYTSEGKLVATYASIKEAAEKTEINQRWISKCAKGKISSHNGFIWKYLRVNE